MYVPSLYLGTLYVFVYTLQRFIRRLCGWAWFLTPKHLEGSFTYILLLGCAICILQDVAVRAARFCQWHPFLLKSTYKQSTKYVQLFRSQSPPHTYCLGTLLSYIHRLGISKKFSCWLWYFTTVYKSMPIPLVSSYLTQKMDWKHGYLARLHQFSASCPT